MPLTISPSSHTERGDHAQTRTRPGASLRVHAAAETSLTGGQTLTIRVAPAMARDPASLRISAVVEPDERNRMLEIKAESAGYATGSQMQLDGLRAQRLWETEFRDVPHGTYEVTATVIGSEGRRATALRVVVITAWHTRASTTFTSYRRLDDQSRSVAPVPRARTRRSDWRADTAAASGTRTRCTASAQP